ncbi:MAG: DUF4252 domain-containing protein [Candidatus Latescibacteria bacterium]|nr:DUF4252 domain-containing protein [Candidatus Latescibacterota bacterium]
MRRYARNALIMVGISSLLISGCLFFPDLEGVEEIIARELEPARLETTVKLKLGPGLLSWAKLVCNWADVEEEVRGCVAEIRRVQLAVYEVHGSRLDRPIRAAAPIRKRLERAGWEILVKVREAEEFCWIFYRLRGDFINELYVIALDNNDLVLVKVEGRFDRMIARVLKDHDLNVSGLMSMR